MSIGSELREGPALASRDAPASLDDGTYDDADTFRGIAPHLIPTAIGIAGAFSAACAGYLIGYQKGGAVTGLLGALCCPVIFVSIYRFLHD